MTWVIKKNLKMYIFVVSISLFSSLFIGLAGKWVGRQLLFLLLY